MGEGVKPMIFKAQMQTARSLVRDRLGCLYGVSILWSILLGVLFYVVARFPLWFFYQTGPSSDERGPFWDVGVVMIMFMTGLLGLPFFGLYLKRWRRGQVTLRRAFTMASMAIPLAILSVIVILWHYNTTQFFRDVDFLRDLWMPGLLWIILGTWVLVFLAPFGLLSGIILDLVVGLKEEPR
jgi:hypothetical protein